MAKVKFGVKLGKGAALATKAQRDATARKIAHRTNAWAKKTMKGVW